MKCVFHNLFRWCLSNYWYFPIKFYGSMLFIFMQQYFFNIIIVIVIVAGFKVFPIFLKSFVFCFKMFHDFNEFLEWLYLFMIFSSTSKILVPRTRRKMRENHRFQGKGCYSCISIVLEVIRTPFQDPPLSFSVKIFSFPCLYIYGGGGSREQVKRI